MPAEVRYIVFARDEIAAAIERYARGTFPDFPAGSVVGMETIGDEEPRLRVLVREQSAEFVQIDIGSQELLSFMIRVCREARVPLPARAPKRLCLVNDRLAIAVVLDGRRYRPASSPRPYHRTAPRPKFRLNA